MAIQNIKADYTYLAEAAVGFGREAERVRAILGGLQERKNVLATAWQGRGAQAFAKEMDTLVLPTFRRLGTALAETQTTLMTVSRVFQTAEDEAVRLVQLTPAWSGEGGALADGSFVPIAADTPTPTPSLTGTPPNDPTLIKPDADFSGTEVPPVRAYGKTPKNQFIKVKNVDRTSLCGSFCVAACLTALDMPCTLDRVLGYSGLDALPAAGQQQTTTSSADLMKFINGEHRYEGDNGLGKGQIIATDFKVTSNPDTTWTTLVEGTKPGSLAMVPVMINGSVAHWVVVSGVGIDKGNTKYVRVYDPLDNTNVHYYKWDDFQKNLIIDNDKMNIVVVSKAPGATATPSAQ